MASGTVSQKLIKDHLVSGEMVPGKEIGLHIDQTLTQDATGTMVMLELEAMGCKSVKTELSAQYVDHNMLQEDFKNADDHIFLQSACQRFGIWYSRAGNGVSHPVHMESFGIPGKTLLGSDSHTCAAGSLGMLAIGTGGLEVALAMMGHPFYVAMPRIFGIKLTGKLQNWVSAKDIILEMLRRHKTSGGVGKIIEYYGEGLKGLSAMDRHVIANMGAELGATTTVFPSDEETKKFLEEQGRGESFIEILADENAVYDENDEIDLSKLEPLIACPSSPDKVVPVREVAGKIVHQCMIGSSANPGFRDFAIGAMIVNDRQIHPHLSFDINPVSRQQLENLIEQRYLKSYVHAGARIHQPGCNGCIGMGQAPASNQISLRTVPRNFPGRSGTEDDLVYLCSPETAAASALTGKITDPRTLNMPYPRYKHPSKMILNHEILQPPTEGRAELIMGPNIKPFPFFSELQDTLDGPILLKAGDNVSTDEILPAGSKVLPYRSNIPKIAEFSFIRLDPDFYNKTKPYKETGFIVIGGANYGQGSSREHAVIAPRFLGLRAVIAKSYARIHRKNLLNFGVLPLVFDNPSDYEKLEVKDELSIDSIRELVKNSSKVSILNKTKDFTFTASLNLSAHEKDILMAGGLINYVKEH
ncbi:aconitate hydratase [Criblamydia sequanensis]|uniref:Aconitate hydratase n=1 Tax=Candidatus Criblamydia sequanensis CRIB-18 TaxID=1437425 RepID=A0A090CYA1_9BACT|nr:aconitate hydratase [Criblamydia sequanensis]CDR33236.1 Aconitate hydratase [Criblamydia sequanensis CRIB-18]